MSFLLPCPILSGVFFSLLSFGRTVVAIELSSGKAWSHLGKVASQMIQNVFLKKLLLSAIVVELPYKSNITVEALPLLFCPVLQLLLEPK